MRIRAYLAKSAHALTLLGALTIAGLTPAGQGLREQFAADDTGQCADVLFVGVRGSGQSPELDEGLGRQVASVRDGLEASLAGSGLTMRTHAIDYSAADFADLIKPSRAFGPLYLDSISEGWASLSNYLESQQACFDQGERLVLAGYSQGALIVHLAIANGWGDLPQLSGALLVADPFRDPGVSNIGTAAPGTGLYEGAPSLAAMGFSIPGADLGSIPSDAAEVTVGLCNEFDIVCDFGGRVQDHLASLGSAGASVHASYTTEQLEQLGGAPARGILWEAGVGYAPGERSSEPGLQIGSRAGTR